MICFLKIIIMAYIDYLFALYLKLSRRNKHIFSMEDLSKIREIEKEAYPKELWTYDNCNSIESFLCECNCLKIEQIYFLLEADWYLLAVRHFNYVELIDFASASHKCPQIMSVIVWLFDNLEKYKVIAECREATSYQIVKLLEKRNKIRIIKDEAYVRNLELFHKVTILKANKKLL